MSQEFASIENPYTGKSYHEGKGNNKASISTNQIQLALRGNGGAPSGGGSGTPPTALASNTNKPEAPKEQKSMLEQLTDSAIEQLAGLDQMLGGKLGIDSIGLQTAFRQMDKEFMNNPTFVDSSTNVSNASAPAPGTAVSASVWDSQMTSLFVDRVAS